MEQQTNLDYNNYKHLADLLYVCYEEFSATRQVTNGILMLCLIRSMKDTFKNRKFKAAIRKRFAYEHTYEKWSIIRQLKQLIEAIYLTDTAKTYCNLQTCNHFELFIKSIFK